jgi:hypothetical protein
LLRAAGETETTQENVQDWLQLDEGDTRYQLRVFLNKSISEIFCLFLSAPPILLKCSFICFLSFSLCILDLCYASLIQIRCLLYILRKDTGFSLLHSFQIPIKRLPAVERAGHEAEHSLPSSSEIRTVELYLHSLIHLHGVMII